MNHIGNNSDSYYKEDDYYDRKVVNKVQESSKNNMNMICNKYGFSCDLVRLLLELEFDLDIYCKIKVSRILYDYNTYGK